jgi:hypothetical protein
VTRRSLLGRGDLQVLDLQRAKNAKRLAPGLLPALDLAHRLVLDGIEERQAPAPRPVIGPDRLAKRDRVEHGCAALGTRVLGALARLEVDDLVLLEALRVLQPAEVEREEPDPLARLVHRDPRDAHGLGLGHGIDDRIRLDDGKDLQVHDRRWWDSNQMRTHARGPKRGPNLGQLKRTEN